MIGEQTTDAVRDFQRGYAFSTLVAGGGVGPRTQTALRISIRRGGRCSQHFTFRSFRSPGDGWIKLDRALVRALEVYRAALGEPVAILAGHRDAEWNAAHGGHPDSQHLHGTAADLEPAMVLDDVLELRVFSGHRLRRADRPRPHVDVRHTRPAPGGATVATRRSGSQLRARYGGSRARCRVALVDPGGEDVCARAREQLRDDRARHRRDVARAHGLPPQRGHAGHVRGRHARAAHRDRAAADSRRAILSPGPHSRGNVFENGAMLNVAPSWPTAPTAHHAVGVRRHETAIS